MMGTRAAIYARERGKPFDKFDAMLMAARRKEFDVIVVTEPWVLGEDYETLSENLKRIGQTGAVLAFAQPGAHLSVVK